MLATFNKVGVACPASNRGGWEGLVLQARACNRAGWEGLVLQATEVGGRGCKTAVIYALAEY